MTKPIWVEGRIHFDLGGAPSPLSAGRREFHEIDFQFEHYPLAEAERHRLTLEIDRALYEEGIVLPFDGGSLYVCMAGYGKPKVALATEHEIATLPTLPEYWETYAAFSDANGAWTGKR